MILEAEQIAIVDAPIQNLCVLASAGSGKTTVIVERVARLVVADALSAAKIAVITFTNLAADEVSNRIAIRLGRKGRDEVPYVGTFHSYCVHLIKEFDPALAARLKILTAGKQFALLYRKFSDWDLQACMPAETRKFEIISRVIRTFDFIALSQTDPELVQIHAPAVASVLREYTSWCEANAYMDFSSMLVAFRKKLDQPDFLEFVLSRLEYLIVDEYQDTDRVQASIVSKLAEKIPVMVVGDDDQCIYQFRGTTPKNIIDFSHYVAGATEKPLSKNFRCRSQIVRLADEVVTKVPGRKTKILTADVSGGTIAVQEFPDVATEAAHIATIIEHQLRVGEIQSYSEVALLFRSVASHAAPYVSALRSRGIPVIIRGDRGLFDQLDVRRLLNLLEVVSSEEATADRLQFLSVALGCELSLPADWRGPSHFDEFGVTEWSALGLDEGLQASAARILGLREKYTNGRFSSFLELLLHGASILDLFSPGKSESGQRNFARLTEVADEYDEVAGGRSLRQFINYLKIFAAKNFDAADLVPLGEDAVSVLTVHQAKGLEFTTVFCPMLVEKRFPLDDRSQPILLSGPAFDLSSFVTNESDERRIFYVAITRAKEYLVLSAPRDVGLQKPKRPSIFLREALPFAVVTPAKVTTRDRDSEDKPINLGSSYSKLEYYLSCPFRYKVIVDIGVCTPPNPFFAFGQLIHLVLRLAHDSHLAGKPIEEAELLAFYETNFPRIYSIPKITVDQMRLRGLEAIKLYLSGKADWLSKTWQTELPFELSRAFQSKQGPVEVVLNGQIDLVIGDSDGYDVIDFKTGKAHSYIRTEFQLQLYSSALREMFGRPPRRATVYYVEEKQEATYDVSDDWIDAGQQLFSQVAIGIAETNFVATPGSVCTRCEVRLLCPYKA